MSFAKLKKNSASTVAALTKKLEATGKDYGDDTRYWKFEVDKAGNGYAVIRFLPEVEGEEYPFVTVYEHSFKDKNTGKWYIERSRTTLGEDDPVSEANSELWNTGIEANKNIARARKRKLQYISNILVVHNPKNPADDGKVFLFKYGSRIFQKIQGALKPEFEDEVSFNPFDFWGGANFKLKARMLDGQRSYDKSEFEKPSALFDGDDAALEKLWKSQYPLLPEVAPDKFKPYDVLKKRFDMVTGNTSVAQNAERGEAPQRQAEPQRPSAAPAVPPDDSDDDDLAAYRALLAED